MEVPWKVPTKFWLFSQVFYIYIYSITTRQPHLDVVSFISSVGVKTPRKDRGKSSKNPAFPLVLDG
jgi:hypothetical protein